MAEPQHPQGDRAHPDQAPRGAGPSSPRLFERRSDTRRYQVTDTGLQHALFLTHVHDHLLRTGLAQLTDPGPLAPSPLRAAARSYQDAFDDLTRQAHLAA
jgi:hypothetical protein